MGIRRRRKKLTTIINSVDRRLRSVEYRSIPTRIKAASITPADIAPGTIPSDDPKDAGATGAISSPTAPSEFSVITAATYSARNITGTVDRVDITTATDHGLLAGEKVTIYGLNNNDVNLDGTYVITEAPTSTTLRFSRGLTGYYQSVINLAVQATVTNRYCSTTTGTLTLNSTSHGFVVGDVITVVGVPDDTFFNGDFKVTAVSGADVSYEFPSTQSAISITSSVGYVKSVLNKYTIVGDTWIDTSVTPNTIKIWDGINWSSGASLPDGVIIDDHMAPKPPTNLSAIASGYYDPNSGSPAIAVTLAWEPPTENADGTPLTDLAGYRVFYRYTREALDGTANGATGYEPPGQETTYGSPASSDATVSGTFSWNNTFTSTTPAVTITTSNGTINTAATVIDIKKGKKTAFWTVTGLADGDNFTVSWSSSSSNKYGAGSVSGTIGSLDYTYSSTPPTTGFSISGSIKATSQTKSSVSATPDITTDIPSTSEVIPEVQWISAGDTDQTNMSMRDISISSTIEFAVQAHDSSRMNYSVYSDSLTIQTGAPAIILSNPSTPTVLSRLGTVVVSWDGLDSEGAVPPAYLDYVEVHLGSPGTFTPSSSTLKGRIEGNAANSLIINGLPYNSTYYAKLVFVSTTGAATQASDSSLAVTVKPLVDADLIENSLNTWPFGADTIDVDSLADGSIAATTLVSGSDADGTAVRVEAKIAAGSIGAVALAANSIVAGKVAAEAITAREIKALSIEAGNIKANEITTDKLVAGELVGYTIRTSSTGQRVEMTELDNIRFYDSTGALTLQMEGTAAVGDSIFAMYSPDRVGNTVAGFPGSGMYMGDLYIGMNSANATGGDASLYLNGGNDLTSILSGDNGVWLTSSAGKITLISGTGKNIDLNGLLINDQGVVQGLDTTGIYSSGQINSDSDVFGTSLSAKNNGGIYGGTLSLSGSASVAGLTSTATIRSNTNAIVDGTLMIGKTTAASWQSTSGTHAASGFIGSANVGANAASFSRTTNNGDVVNFYRGTTTIVGHIDVTTNSTAYVTSSDYRIKENINPLENAISRLLQLKPSRFNFISEPDQIVDGFLAHEVQPIVPEAVSGEKDAVYEDGTPHLQGIDQAKLVPLLTAAIQELNARLQTLEER